jgi:hypothetical protein
MRATIAGRHIAIALAGVLIGLVLSGAANAIVETTFRYSTPQTGYLMIPAAAFAPQSNVDAYSNNGILLDVTGAPCFAAPLNLPQSARITQLATWYQKNDAGSASAQIVRVTPSAPSAQNIATLVLPASAGAIHVAAIGVTDPSLQTVNNARYGYFVLQCLTDQEQLVSARIKYTYTRAGD